MAEKLACSIAVVIHFFMRISIFMKPSSECSPCVPYIASVMIMLALCMLLLDNTVIPERYRHAMGPKLLVPGEIVTVLMFLEIGMNVVWCKLESILVSMLKSAFLTDGMNMYANIDGDTFTGFCISAVAFAVLVNVAIMTDWIEYLKLHILNVWRSRQMRSGIECCNGGSCGDVKEDLKAEITMVSPKPEYMPGEETSNDCDQYDSPDEPELPKPKRQRQKVTSLRSSIEE